MATPRSQRSSVVQVHRTQDGVLRVEDGAVQRMSVTNPYIGNEIHEARAAANKEHEMSVRDAIKLYKKGMAYSILLSMAVVMEGYDLSVVGSFFGFPAFKNKYGTEPDPTDGGKLISAPWQTGLLNGVQVRD